MLRFSKCLAILAILSGAPALACSLPPPQCDVRNGQVATLHDSNGQHVMFEQHDPNAPAYTPTYVLVTCDDRLAVAFGPMPDRLYDKTSKGLYAMSDALHGKTRPSLRDVHRSLRSLGLPSRRFKLMADHCGCELPTLPPPPVSCPPY